MGQGDIKDQDIALEIRVRQRDSAPYSGTVDIELQHQTLSERREIRDVDASKPIDIARLRRAPQGLYRLTVTPSHAFAPHSQFVNIPASGFAQVEVVIESEGERASIVLVDDQGRPQAAPQPGGPLVLNAAGLRPSAAHTIAIADDGGEIVTQTLFSDAKGQIRGAVLWPQIGIDDPRDTERLPVEEASKRWFGRTITLMVRDGERAVGELRFRLPEREGSLAVATDANGRLLNGFEIGEDHARLTLLDLTPGEDWRIWMVPRQHEWHDGDAISPVRLASGRMAQADIRVAGAVERAQVARGDELVPGAYDFVIRRIRYGYEDDDDLVLRPGDLMTSRLSTGLVVREKFFPSKVIRGGCTNLQLIAGRRTLGNIWPYIQFTDTFQVGEDVWGALDPLALDPAHTGKMVAMYVVPHKPAAQDRPTHGPM